MVTIGFVVLLFFTSVKSNEDVGTTNNDDLSNTYHRSFDYSEIPHFEKRDTQLLPAKSSQQENITTTSQDSKPLKVQTNMQEDAKHVNSEQKNTVLGQSEGGLVNDDPYSKPSVQTLNVTQTNSTKKSLNENPRINDNASISYIVANKTNIESTPETTNTSQLLDNPGVVKRGLIVFGGITLVAIAYFIFYRRKSKNFETSNTHGNSDVNQFRYGVLQSDDRRDNLELSRIPLTMESDDEEEEDLEIFDLEQKRKSLSYVNLQTNDEDIILHSSNDESKNNLLLDIEDGPSDTLINWSSNVTDITFNMDAYFNI